MRAYISHFEAILNDIYVMLKDEVQDTSIPANVSLKYPERWDLRRVSQFWDIQEENDWIHFSIDPKWSEDPVKSASEWRKKWLRIELMEPRELWPKEWEEHEYSFDVTLPKGFPTNNKRLMFAQFKQHMQSTSELEEKWYTTSAFKPDPSPILAFRIQGGRFMITLDTDNMIGWNKRDGIWRTILFSEDMDRILEEQKNFQFSIKTKFSRKWDGYVSIYRDWKVIVDKRNVITAYNEESWFPPRDGKGEKWDFYFKCWLYGDNTDVDWKTIHTPLSLTIGNFNHIGCGSTAWNTIRKMANRFGSLIC